MELQPDQAQKVLHEVNNLRTEAMWFLGALAGAYVMYSLLMRWMSHRAESNKESSKQERANMYAGALTKLSATMEKVDNTLCNVDASHSTLVKAVDTLTIKVTGQINKEDSIRMIRDRFMTHIYREFCNITERSLTSNHYDSQREHIQRKVKTAFSSVLFDSRAFLTSFNLSVDANTFFKLDSKNIGERFVIVDMLWLQVEPLYRGSPETLRHRVEEAFLLLENTITDYVVVCAKGQQINIDFRRATKASTKMIDVSTGLMDTGAHSRHEFEAFERQQGDKA